MQKKKFIPLFVIILSIILITPGTVLAISQIWLQPIMTIKQTPNFGESQDSIHSSPIKNIKISLLTSTVTPTLTPMPTHSPNPAGLIFSVSLSNQQTLIMNEVNQYRKSQGLYPVISDKNTCAFASTRAQEITTGFNHNGFNDRVSVHTLPYPSYHEVTENLAEAPSYQEVVNLWINSPGHAENMRRDTPYVCVESSGNFYAYEGWRP